jgi:hypothetical protein
VKTVTRLVTPVSEIDKATSPWASLVIMFEVGPPGQNDRIMRPSARCGESPARRATI